MLKKNLTRESLTNKVYKEIGLSKNISKSLVKDIFDEIINALNISSAVKISSFGTFKKIRKKERIGRNPKTKVPAKISARSVIVFKASNILKSKINDK